MFGPYGVINTAVAFNANTKTGMLVYGPGSVAMFDDAGVFTSPDAFHSFSQDAHAFGPSSFGLAGSFLPTDFVKVPEQVNGVAVSTNNGKDWEFFDAGLDHTPRYSSFPSDSTWYVTAGTWSATDDSLTRDMFNTTSNVFHYSSKITAHLESNAVKMKFNFDQQLASTSSPYRGSIAKTTDAGKTWKTVYDTSDLYFNQIDCFDELHCMAVGEANDNAYVLSTSNGGATWATVFSTSDKSSMMGCNMLSKTEAWVSGGNFSPEDKALVGLYWHTVDAGETWTTESLLNAMSMDMDFAPNGDGYSTATSEVVAGIAMYH